MTNANIIALFQSDADELARRIESAAHTLMGENTVVRMAPGLYMSVQGNTAIPVGLVDGVTLYSPENAAKVIKALPSSCATVLWVDALRTELAEAQRMLALFSEE